MYTYRPNEHGELEIVYCDDCKRTPVYPTDQDYAEYAPDKLRRIN